MALAGVTQSFVYLEEGDCVDINLEGYRIENSSAQEVHRELRELGPYHQGAQLGPYQHHMQKEIFEQPQAIADTLEGVVSIGPELFEMQGKPSAKGVFERVQRILILACGTSYYAGSTAKYWLEGIAKIPTQVEIASEYRYRESVQEAGTLVVSITQSGETADTLAAVRHAVSL
jgi:glucosamine--fructose-6-phosphate aminotransferase (isomerizing)